MPKCQLGGASPLPRGKSGLIPDGAVGLAHPPVGTQYEKAVEATSEPTIMRHGNHRALKRLQRSLQGVGRVQIEVVGRLIKQKQRRSGKLE